MATSEDLRQRLRSLIESNDVVLFMKGNRAFPQCGFSASVAQILDSLLPEYATVDVLADGEIRQGIKEYSSWPTIPQLYIKGELIGGSDIVASLYATGELHKKLGLEGSALKLPTIQLSAAAVRLLREYAAGSGDDELHLSIDAGLNARVSVGPRQETELVVEAHGVRLLMDAVTAQRADGTSIDCVETLQGARFKVDGPVARTPAAPAQVRQMTPRELQEKLQSSVKLELFDVRTPEERAIARIEGSRWLDAEVAAYIGALPRDTLLVFHCHHGMRSQEAAEYFAARGFRNVWNLAGGIDAWSLDVDSRVARYQ